MHYVTWYNHICKAKVYILDMYSKNINIKVMFENIYYCITVVMVASDKIAQTKNEVENKL